MSHIKIHLHHDNHDKFELKVLKVRPNYDYSQGDKGLAGNLIEDDF